MQYDLANQKLNILLERSNMDLSSIREAESVPFPVKKEGV